MGFYSDAVLKDSPVAYWQCSDGPGVNLLQDPGFESGSLASIQKSWFLNTVSQQTFVNGPGDYLTGSGALKRTTTDLATSWAQVEHKTSLSKGGSNNLISVIPGQQ